MKPIHSCLLATPLFLVATLSTCPASAEPPKQLVIVSFDGAGDNRLWEKSRELARRTGARFTYFLSCTLIMDRANAKSYQAPGMKAGRSNVGFGQNAAEVRERLGHIWAAHNEGHEIASHACGHFDGKDWSENDWYREITLSRKTLADAWKAIGAKAEEPQGWQEFADRPFKGFRAPYLSSSASLVEAEKRAGVLYDASGVTKGPALPQKIDGMTGFGLPLVPEGPGQRPVIGMDYNLFVRHTLGIETPARSQEFEDRTFAAFKLAFDTQYAGARIPVQLGFHFVEMNGGAYWRALDRLLTEVCSLADVACVTYAQAMERLDSGTDTGNGLPPAL